MEDQTIVLSAEKTISKYFANVYKWMTLALAITALVAWQVASTEVISTYIFSHKFLLIILIIAQFAPLIVLFRWLDKMSFTVALLLFLGYAALTGFIFSNIFLAYSLVMISKAFVTTAGMYGAMAVYGYFTKRDLSPWGSFLFMSLIGILLGSFINIWLQSDYVDFMVTYGGIITFAGLTAYDHQKLKAFALMDVNGKSNLAVIGALTLYLDFINLFIFILRAFDRR